VPAGIDLTALASRVVYEGSPEHKRYPYHGRPPGLRADASDCDKAHIGRDAEFVAWLREALLNGHIGAPWEGDFPRYLWRREGDVVYEARLTNREQGAYKGYPLKDEMELPEGI